MSKRWWKHSQTFLGQKLSIKAQNAYELSRAWNVAVLSAQCSRQQSEGAPSSQRCLCCVWVTLQLSRWGLHKGYCPCSNVTRKNKLCYPTFSERKDSVPSEYSYCGLQGFSSMLVKMIIYLDTFIFFFTRGNLKSDLPFSHNLISTLLMRLHISQP